MSEFTKRVWSARIQIVYDDGEYILGFEPSVENDPLIGKIVEQLLEQIVDELNAVDRDRIDAARNALHFRPQ